MNCKNCLKLEKEIRELKESIKFKIEECDELRERFKAISASYCYTLGTDFD